MTHVVAFCTLPSDVCLRQNLHVLINTQCFGPVSEAQGHVGNGMFPRGYISSRSEHHIDWCFRAFQQICMEFGPAERMDFVFLTSLDTVSPRILLAQQHQPFLSVAFLAQIAFCIFYLAAWRLRDEEAG